jgi:hypothetical protein
MNNMVLDRIRILSEFGLDFLTPSERDRRLNELLSDYFDRLAVECFHFPDREFWRLHREMLDELGYSLYNRRFARAIAAKFLDLALNPKATIERILRRAKSTGSGTRRG